MASHSWENLIRNSIKTGLIVSVLMPLVFSKEHVFTISSQVFFFQTTVLIVLGLFFVLNIFSCRSHLPKLTPVTLGLVVFTVSFFISAFAGVDWHMSLWDSPYFMRGAVFLLFGLIYYLIMSQVFLSLNDWRWPLRFIAGISGVVILLGIVFSEGGLCQLFGQRMSSVLGNPVFLGGHAMMVFFLGLIGLTIERSLPWRVFFIVCSSLVFLGVLFSGTRSAMFGLAVGLVIMALWYGFKFIKEKRLSAEVRWIGVILFTAIFILLAWQVVCNFLNTDDVLMTGVTRAYSADPGVRLIVWQGALEAWIEKPLLGWGPNNFEYAFSSYYQPEVFLYNEALAWPDGVWNVWLEALVERGIFGLISLLFLLGITFWSLFAGYKKGRVPFFVLVIGTAFLLAYFTHLSFIFDLASMVLLFFIFLALVNSLTAPRSDENPSHLIFNIKKRPFLILGIFVAFLFMIFIFIVLLPWVAENLIYSAGLLLEEEPERAMEIYDKVAKRLPTPYFSELQINFFMSGLVYFDKWERQQVEQFVDFGLISLQTETDNKKPKIIPLLRRAEIARQASYALDNEILLKDAEKLLEKAYLLSPRRQQIIFSLATVKMELSNPEEAYQLVREGIEITPTAPQGWLRLIWFHEMNNDREKAQIVFQEAKNRGIIFSSRHLESVEQILSPDCCKKGQIF